MYIDTALTLLRDLKIGSENGEITTLHQASHALKACSATIGAASLAALCAELEGMARTGAVPGAVARTQAIIEEYQRVETVLIRRLARPKPSSAEQQQSHVKITAHR